MKLSLLLAAVGRILLRSDPLRRALEEHELRDAIDDGGHDLHGRRARTDDADAATVEPDAGSLGDWATPRARVSKRTLDILSVSRDLCSVFQSGGDSWRSTSVSPCRKSSVPGTRHALPRKSSSHWVSTPCG